MCLRAERSITYFKNGVSLGVAFRDIPEDRLHPCVGMRSQGEEVLVKLLGSGEPQLPGAFISVDFDALFETFKRQVCEMTSMERRGGEGSIRKDMQ